MRRISDTAIVSQTCRLGPDVSIGARCRIGDGVTIGDGTRLQDDVKIEPGVKIGRNNTISHGNIIKAGTRIGHHNTFGEHGVIGGAPLIADPVASGTLEIGDCNEIREFATLQVGSGRDGVTQIGSRNFLMPNVQVGHDSRVGDHNVMSNQTALCGHVDVADRVVFGVGAIVHQHCRIGRLAMIGATAYVSRDVVPFVLIDGRSGGVVGLNRVGLKRNQMDSSTIQRLKQAYRIVFRSGLSRREILGWLERVDCDAVAGMLAFIRESRRGLERERRSARCDQPPAESISPTPLAADACSATPPTTLPFPGRRAA